MHLDLQNGGPVHADIKLHRYTHYFATGPQANKCPRFWSIQSFGGRCLWRVWRSTKNVQVLNIFEYTVRICNIFNIYSRIEVCSIIADRNINTVNSPICAPKLALPATCQYDSTSCFVMFSWSLRPKQRAAVGYSTNHSCLPGPQQEVRVQTSDCSWLSWQVDESRAFGIEVDGSFVILQREKGACFSWNRLDPFSMIKIAVLKSCKPVHYVHLGFPAIIRRTSLPCEIRSQSVRGKKQHITSSLTPQETWYSAWSISSPPVQDCLGYVAEIRRPARVSHGYWGCLCNCKVCKKRVPSLMSSKDVTVFWFNFDG